MIVTDEGLDFLEAIKSASLVNKGIVELRLASNDSVCNLFAGEIKIMLNLRYLILKLFLPYSLI